MALRTTPENLLEEAEAAHRLCLNHIEATQDLIRDYAGRYHRTDRKPDDPVPENHFFEWLATVTPSVIYDNPKVEVKSRRYGIPEAAIIEMEEGMNQLVRDTDLAQTLMEVWYDMAFNFGVLRVSMEPLAGYPGYMGIRPQRPVADRLDPHLFLIDAKANSPMKARFMGHIWKRDKDALLKDPSFNRKEVEALIADADLEKHDRDPVDPASPDRDEIVGYELWVPEVTLPGYEDDPDYNGTLYTMGVTVDNDGKRDKPRWLKDPRPCFASRQGPYTLFGVYRIPGQVYPLAPLAANADQVKDLNAHEAAAARAAARRKSFIAYDANNTEAGKRAKEVRDGDVVAIPNLSGGSMQEMELGGTTDNQTNYIDRLKLRLDRSSGLNDAARGMVSGKGTATEQAEAATQRANRLSLIQRCFATATCSALRGMAWMMFTSDTAVQPIGPDAADRMLAANPEFNGYVFGGFRERYDMTFDEMQLDIEPYSMARTDELLLRSQMGEFMDRVIQVAPIMATTPQIRWKELFNELGQTMNRPSLGDRILDDEMMEMQNQQAQMESRPMVDPATGLPVGPDTSGGATDPADAMSLEGAMPGPMQVGASTGQMAANAAGL